jgi:glutamate 5-kinase
MTTRSELVQSARHVVVKIGSAVLLDGDERVDRRTFVSLIADLNSLLEEARRVTVVSSGAVALGRQRLTGDSDDGRRELPRLQALAALGQARLIQMYDREFAEYGRRCAQILLGRADLDQRTSFLNARTTLDAVHRLDAVPIVNENDTVATEELRFGDNDELAAMTCGIVGADLLVILSDVPGILERHGDELGDRIPMIGSDEERLDELAGPSTSGFGRGGMISKVASARAAARFGCPTVVAPGKRPDVLRDLFDGADVGTVVVPPETDALQGRKVWLGAGAIAAGKLRCDAGAVRAVTRRGASLLPTGITDVVGDFAEGSVVDLVAPDGDPFARGMSTYSATDVRKIAGHNSDEIADILGYKVLDAVVHRDNLLLL